jgi:hypothetical protein
VALDTIDVFVLIHEDYSSAIESDDEAPKFVTPQREPKNKKTTSDNDSNLFYSSNSCPSDGSANVIPANANYYDSGLLSLCPANDVVVRRSSPLTFEPFTKGKDGIVVKASQRNMSRVVFELQNRFHLGAVVFALGKDPLPTKN